MCKPQKCIIQYDLLKSIKWLRKKVARFYFIMEMKLSYIEEGLWHEGGGNLMISP